jgi:hypothetical protein
LPICRSITLSSTEAEYYALSQVTKEVIFSKLLVLDSMGIGLSLPIRIKVDNIGAINLARSSHSVKILNILISSHTLYRNIKKKEQSTHHWLNWKTMKQTYSPRIHLKRYSWVTGAH